MKPHSDPNPDHHHHRHHDHPHHHLRLSVPSRNPSIPPTPFPSSSTPTPSSLPTPNKRRQLSSRSTGSSLSSLFLLLFSLRSLYSLLPFVRAAPSSFSLFPFSFLVSLSSFLFLLPFSPSLLLPLSRPQFLSLASKSLLLSLVLLFRFHSLVYCRAGASIVADLSGSLLARFLTTNSSRFTSKNVIGLISLTLTLLFLSWSWDRVGCFPLSNDSHSTEGCVHLASMLMPFLSGFLGFFEQNTLYWGQLRELGKRRVRVLSLGLTTVFLFIPALVSFFSSRDDDLLSVSSLGWPLVNTVIFGVILSENYSSEEKKASSAKEFRKGILLTFVCTLVLELFYYPKLSLAGFLLCGFFLWISVLQLGPSPLNYIELGNLDDSVSIYSSIMGPIKHILSERKSRKIAVFLLINAGYMVVEFVVGFLSNSLGLISDACHMLFDCAALAIGLYASYIARLPANSQFNYARGRFEVLSGYVNAVFLVLVGALIVLESFERILDPMEISTGSLLAVSVGGLLVNVIGLVFFHEEHHHAHGGGSCSHGHQHHHNHNHAHPNGDDGHGRKASHVPNHNEISHKCSTGHKHLHSHTHENSCSSDQGEGKACTDHHVHESHQGDLHLHLLPYEHAHDHHEHDARSCSKHNHDSIHGHLHENHNDHSSKHHHHHHVDHNMEGIFLHVLADTMGSVGVVISTLLIKYKGWLVADPICSVFISIMIVSSVLPLLRNSAEILLQRVPRNHEKELKRALDDALHIKGVCGVHNMHVWNLTNTDIVGSFHLCLSEEADKVSVLKSASDIFHDAGIKDLTIQLENVRTRS